MNRTSTAFIRGNVALLLLFILLVAGKAPGKFKTWDAHNKLTWKDFKDTLITDSHRAAATNSGIRLDFTQTEQNSLTVNAICAMYPDGSWVDSTRKSDYILLHEQYHFNITEYWCRKLKKDLAAARYSTKNFKEKIELIRKDDYSQCRDMQIEYDKETKHSEISEEQKKWERKVDELLKNTEDYSGNTITIKLH